MTEENFDANERIAGFSLARIKKALSWVGVLDERNDVDNVAQALHCPIGQALRVLDELERREFVTKAKKRNQWATTLKGRQLAFHWQPPRRYSPAIDRNSRAINECFDSVRCGILRTVDREDMFEEAEVTASVNVEYEGERLVEINLCQPDDYDDEAGGSNIVSSIYLAPTDAKIFVIGLQKAIKKAELIVARSAAAKTRRSPTRSK